MEEKLPARFLFGFNRYIMEEIPENYDRYRHYHQGSPGTGRDCLLFVITENPVAFFWQNTSRLASRLPR